MILQKRKWTRKNKGSIIALVKIVEPKEVAMAIKRALGLALVFSLIVSVVIVAQPMSYAEFFGDFITKRVNQLRDDVNQLETILDSWNNGETSQSTVVAKLEEMETRADSYFQDILSLPPPEGRFKKYSQSIYVCVTWSNIIGIFAEAMTDLNMAKLDAASILSDHFEKRVDTFEQRIGQNGG